jgi:N-hydroxyarylamine O-acetyltransferase
MLADDFNLNAYFAWIGLGRPAGASLAALRTTIPFETLDIVIGCPIRLDIALLQAKLVATQRGGYGLKQNTLL